MKFYVPDMGNQFKPPLISLSVVPAWLKDPEPERQKETIKEEELWG